MLLREIAPVRRAGVVVLVLVLDDAWLQVAVADAGADAGIIAGADAGTVAVAAS